MTITSAIFLIAANCHCTYAFAVPQLRKFNQEYHFPAVSYTQALQNIHVLEHLLRVDKSYFKIHSTTEPVRYGNYIVASAKCSIKSIYQQDIKIFAKQGNVSHIVCIKDGTPQMMFEIRVAPAVRGHLMTINASTYLNAPLWMNMMLVPLWSFLSLFEEAMLLQYNVMYDENLVKYRKMLFNKTETLEY
jgi:hypothetical protein